MGVVAMEEICPGDNRLIVNWYECKLSMLHKPLCPASTKVFLDLNNLADLTVQ